MGNVCASKPKPPPKKPAAAADGQPPVEIEEKKEPTNNKFTKLYQGVAILLVNIRNAD